MNETDDTTRRRMLKTLGASAVGGAVLTGTASAASENTEIDLRGHNFTPNRATVELGGQGGSATVTWINDEVKYSSEEFPVPHDVHLHYGEEDLVESGIFTQMEEFMGIPLGPNFYEVEFREEDGDLVVEEVGGKVASTAEPPYVLQQDDDRGVIENWGGSVTLDVHCSIHGLLLDVNEGELISRAIQSEETEPPYALHGGFLKMDGGLTITR